MPKISHTVTYRATQERVWECLTDASIDSVPANIHVEFIPPGPAHVGQIIRRTLTRPAGEERLEVRCTEADAPRAHTLEWDELFQGKVPFRYTQRTTLRALPDGTECVQEVTIRAPDPIAWFIAWLAKPQWTRRLVLSLEAARDRIEAAGSGRQ